MWVMEPEAFYEALGGGRYTSTELTRGPWDAGAQHAGPPAALLGYAVEHRDGAHDDVRVARFSVEIGRPVPIAPLRVVTRVVRDGASVSVVEAVLSGDDDREYMRALAVCVRAVDGSAPAVEPDGRVADPEAIAPTAIPFMYETGYHTGMETRWVSGAFTTPGPATVWFRMRRPLVAGEPVGPLSRVLIAADSGNGVSSVLDHRRYLFVNPELTVHLRRYPRGEWICLDSVTTVDPGGIGLAETVLHDTAGPIGRGAQSLFVRERR
jgi:hypothetical protein